jgi:hypothetical protein
VSAIKQLQPAPQISYISTGGGAGLELIRGSLLPGIQALAAAAAAMAAATAARTTAATANAAAAIAPATAAATVAAAATVQQPETPSL